MIISSYTSLALASWGNVESWEGYSPSIVSGNRQDLILAYLFLLPLLCSSALHRVQSGLIRVGRAEEGVQVPSTETIVFKDSFQK